MREGNMHIMYEVSTSTSTCGRPEVKYELFGKRFPLLLIRIQNAKVRVVSANGTPPRR